MKLRGVRYKGPDGHVLVNGVPVKSGTIIVAPADTVAEFCSRGDCEPVYEEPEEEGAAGALAEEKE